MAATAVVIQKVYQLGDVYVAVGTVGGGPLQFVYVTKAVADQVPATSRQIFAAAMLAGAGQPATEFSSLEGTVNL